MQQDYQSLAYETKRPPYIDQKFELRQENPDEIKLNTNVLELPKQVVDTNGDK